MVNVNFCNYSIISYYFDATKLTTNLFTGLAVTLMLTAGSLFVVWLGNMNTQFGIGGTITIILFNIISGTLPNLLSSIGKIVGQSYGVPLVGINCACKFWPFSFWISFNRAYYPIKMVNK